MKKMRPLVLTVLSCANGAPAFAQQAQDATYVRGTVKTLREGAVGSVDKGSPAALEFQSGSEKFSIPYTRVTAFRYHEESQFHLGVLPAIAVGLFTYWAKRHFVTITWNGENGVSEVVTLEAPKSTVQGFVELMRARASIACKPGERGQIPQTCGTQSFD
jgi:hypothetical protein